MRTVFVAMKAGTGVGEWQLGVADCGGGGTVGGERRGVVAAGRVGRAAVELPRGTPVSKGVVEKPEGDCWQRRGHVNVDQACMVNELRLWIWT